MLECKLAALLLASAAGATHKPSPVKAPPPRVEAPSPVTPAAPEEDSDSPAEVEPPPSGDDAHPTAPPPGTFTYQFSQVQRVAIADGRTRVSVETGLTAPKGGFAPLHVFIDNSAGPRQTISLTYRARGDDGVSVISRAVEVAEGAHLPVTIPIPSGLLRGEIEARGPGIASAVSRYGSFGVTLDGHRSVLTLGKPGSFQKFVGRPPELDFSSAEVQVAVVPLDQAPVEPAAYVGYEAVVLPEASTLEHLDEAQRRALEAYAALGGTLIIQGSLRTAAAFPLAKDLRATSQHYGFGVLVQDPGGTAPSALKEAHRLAVSPQNSTQARRYPRGSLGNYNLDEFAPLLPQATAPVGSFLFIMTIFTLLIGPGSLWVAKRRGAAALLITIPGTAFATCALIVGYSAFADGFTVHSASYGYTLLDSANHRAITAGLSAYYANLAPSKASFPGLVVPLAPWQDRAGHTTANLEWRDGARFGSDFLPSRRYREWGLLSVEPTRARLVLKKKGQDWVVQNALGAKVGGLWVRVHGKLLHGGEVADGSEGPLVEQNAFVAPLLPTDPRSRFEERVRGVFEAAPGEMEFVAVLTGQAFVPTGGLITQLHDGGSLVRGEVEE